MAFDPQREDYLRLGLRFARSLDAIGPSKAARAFATFGRRFAQNRDSLPQSDADRAFHLVVRATRLIDYDLPFATDEDAPSIIDEGHAVLEEAIHLDSRCYDAIRMQAASDCPSFDAFLCFLDERAPEVRAFCVEERAKLGAIEDGERARLTADLCMRPYIRWVASQAEEALICGRNKEALRLCFQLLELDPQDMADVRFTAAYAYAKLEDEAGLDGLVSQAHSSGRTRASDDAWMSLARIALRFKANDLSAASQLTEELIARYPHGAEALIRGQELPDGVFARLPATPYSEDEIILAVSEGMVLFQEGIDPAGRGVFGRWIGETVAERHPRALLAVLMQADAPQE